MTAEPQWKIDLVRSLLNIHPTEDSGRCFGRFSMMFSIEKEGIVDRAQTLTDSLKRLFPIAVTHLEDHLALVKRSESLEQFEKAEAILDEHYKGLLDAVLNNKAN